MMVDSAISLVNHAAAAARAINMLGCVEEVSKANNASGTIDLMNKRCAWMQDEPNPRVVTINGSEPRGDSLLLPTAR